MYNFKIGLNFVTHLKKIIPTYILAAWRFYKSEKIKQKLSTFTFNVTGLDTQKLYKILNLINKTRFKFWLSLYTPTLWNGNFKYEEEPNFSWFLYRCNWWLKYVRYLETGFLSCTI